MIVKEKSKKIILPFIINLIDILNFKIYVFL